MSFKIITSIFAFIVISIFHRWLVDDLKICKKDDSVFAEVDTIIRVKLSEGRRFFIHEKRNTLESVIEIIPRGYSKTLDTFKLKNTGPIDDVFVTDLNQDGNKELLLITKGPGKYPLKEIWAYETLNEAVVRPITVRTEDFRFIKGEKVKDYKQVCVNRFKYTKGELKETYMVFLSANHYWMPNHFVSRRYLLASDSAEAKLIPIPII